jgi:ribosomal-protein-alanine N-acetyltransferase
VIVRRPDPSELQALAEFAAPLQRRPERHVAYLGLDPGEIAEEMIEDVDDWTEAAAVAESDGRIVGWLMGSIDHDMGRVWWFGPFVEAESEREWRAVADALDTDARARLGDHVREEEYAPDERNVVLTRWAVDRGATVDTGSAVLGLTEPLDPPSDAVSIRPVTDDDVASVGPLHEALFPGTHTTGEALVTRRDDDHVRLVAEADGEVLGYVAVERHPGTAGYIDFVGVDPARRRRGLGAELIRAGVAALREIGCDEVDLTVRADNDGARAMYVGLGFVEERVIVPIRRGFSLG